MNDLSRCVMNPNVREREKTPERISLYF